MQPLKTIALHAATLALTIVAQSISLEAQTAKSVNPANSIAASISISMTPTNSVKATTVTAGQTPLVTLTLKNTGSQVVNEEIDLDILPHVDGEKGEPPKTLYHRRRRHEPGLPDLALGPRVSRGIAPGKSVIKGFDLTKYYDLSVPGKYSVYMEVGDGSGKWLRTNTAKFEIQAPAQ